MMKMKKQMMKVYTAAAMKALQAKQKIRETSGEGYVDTAVKILIAVVLGALLLGVGMCLTMVFGKMVLGIVIGLVGIVALLMLIPLTKGIH